MSSEDPPIPRVPDVTDPQPRTPLTEDFSTGTANDPALEGATEPTRLTVDGETVRVDSGETLLDAIESVGADVPALCHYDQSDEIGPAASVGPASSRPTGTGSFRRVASRPRRD